MRRLAPGARWLSVGSNEEGLATVASGRADAYVGTLPALDALIRDRYAATLRVVGPAGVDQDFTVGIVNRYDRLAPMINRVFASVKDSERQAIRGRWLTAQYRYGVPWAWVLAGLAIALVVIAAVGFSYLWQRRAMRAQRVAEQALAAQLKFQQALLETIPYPVFVKDEEGRYLAINRAYEDMFGCARGDLLGRTMIETHHAMGLDAAMLHEADMQAMAQDSGGQRELYIGPTATGGDAHDALLWRHTFERGAGQGRGLLGTLVDVSDLRRAEARALASEQKLIDTNESLPGVVMRVRYARDGLSSFDYVGGQSVALFGLTHDELLQGRRRPFDVMVEEDKPRVRQAIERVRAGEGAHSVEYRVASPSGSRWVRASFGPPRAEDDGVVSCSVFCIDITHEKAQAEALIEAKAAAEAAVKAKSAFLAMMSHEIRTPMAGVLSLVELLGKTSLDGDQAHMLDMVHDSSETLLQILDDILDFSRIEAGRLQLNEHAFDLRVMTDGVLGLFASLAREKGVRLYASLDWRLAAEYRGDMTRVRQIITNLLSNALKFTAKGRVELHMELLQDNGAGHRVSITVSDTGIGMSQDQLDRLFQPFVQAEASTSRRYGGTGLGLTICRRLAHMMNGEIRLASTPGFGTQATFEVPLLVEQALRPQPALAGKKALLCTSDILLERELSHTLSALGMSIVGADAMDLHEYDPQDIDIYVVDLELASRGVLPEGVCSIRLLDIPEPRGFYREHDEVMLGCQPLLWRSAIDACHVALGLSPPPHAVAESAGSQRHDARILVAEDHPINRAVISRQLERLGYPHTIVENGQDALRALATSSYDLLITDCHMPVLDGYTLARRIREQEHESDKHLPIVALSASALPEEVSRCRDAGMDEFLAKPVQLAELGAMLSACLTGGFVRGSDGREPAKPDQWRLLLETFGSQERVRDVLRSLIAATREDLAGRSRRGGRQHATARRTGALCQ
jgi:PAS domain S-box-containing protein